jgi:hypothetical protein
MIGSRRRLPMAVRRRIRDVRVGAGAGGCSAGACSTSASCASVTSAAASAPPAAEVPAGFLRRRRRLRGFAGSAPSPEEGSSSADSSTVRSELAAALEIVVRAGDLRADSRFGGEVVVVVFVFGAVFVLVVRVAGRRALRAGAASGSPSPSSRFDGSSSAFCREAAVERLRLRRRAGAEEVSGFPVASSVGGGDCPRSASDGASWPAAADLEVPVPWPRPLPPRRRRRGRVVAGPSSAAPLAAGTGASSVISKSFLRGASRSRSEGPHAPGGAIAPTTLRWLVPGAEIKSRSRKTNN